MRWRTSSSSCPPARSGASGGGATHGWCSHPAARSRAGAPGSGWDGSSGPTSRGTTAVSAVVDGGGVAQGGDRPRRGQGDEPRGRARHVGDTRAAPEEPAQEAPRTPRLPSPRTGEAQPGSSIEGRPAFYAARGGGGGGLVDAPPSSITGPASGLVGDRRLPGVHRQLTRLVATLLAFFFAVGLAAHTLDELNGRPLGTRIPSGALVAVTVVGLAAAVALGIAGVGGSVGPWSRSWCWGHFSSSRTTWSSSAGSSTTMRDSPWRGDPSRYWSPTWPKPGVWRSAR